MRAVSLMEGQESERKCLVQDLHDGIGQMLTGLRLHSQEAIHNAVKYSKASLIIIQITDNKRCKIINS